MGLMEAARAYVDDAIATSFYGDRAYTLNFLIENRRRALSGVPGEWDELLRAELAYALSLLNKEPE